VQCSRDHSQETLFFYTHLRLPRNFSNSQKKQHLKYIIEAMGLFDYRHMTMASVASALTQAKPFRHVLHCATPRMPRFWRRVCAHMCSFRAAQCNALQHGEANAIRKRLNIAVELVRMGLSQCEALVVLRLCTRYCFVLYCVALHSTLVGCVGFAPKPCPQARRPVVLLLDEPTTGLECSAGFAVRLWPNSHG
jgi:hypothetical protein